jgi:hypothetical protein
MQDIPVMPLPSHPIDRHWRDPGSLCWIIECLSRSCRHQSSCLDAHMIETGYQHVDNFCTPFHIATTAGFVVHHGHGFIATFKPINVSTQHRGMANTCILSREEQQWIARVDAIQQNSTRVQLTCTRVLEHCTRVEYSTTTARIATITT